jgi:hypothetical protein
MKIAIASPGVEREHLDGSGALEMRWLVNTAHFLRTEGHEVHFFDTDRGCDESFDLAVGCLIEHCSNIKAKTHIHHSFRPKCLRSSDVQNTACYQRGEYIYSNPYRKEYLEGLGMMAQGFKHQQVFLPIPYPDDLLPPNLEKGFTRTQIMWGNKGNFDPALNMETQSHFVTNGIAHLEALILLNKRVDFKITFLLDDLLRKARPEWGVEPLIAQLKNVERMPFIPWTELVKIMGQCKLNTHAGGLTSSVNEAVFTHGVSVTPENAVHLGVVHLTRGARETTAAEIYDVYERLWFDEKFYLQIYEVYQDVFADHRTNGLRKYWKNTYDIAG